MEKIEVEQQQARAQPHLVSSRRWLRKTLIGLAAVSGFSFGWLAYQNEAAAFSCNNGTCMCGSADIDPTTGQPKLPSGSWPQDCSSLQQYCGEEFGDYACTTMCGPVCCAGMCRGL